MAKQLKQPVTEEQAGKIRSTIYIDPKQLDKIKYIAFMDDKIESQTSFINDAINKAVAEWEKKNGEAVKR